jgi:hypothetical protein
MHLLVPSGVFDACGAPGNTKSAALAVVLARVTG